MHQSRSTLVRTAVVMLVAGLAPASLSWAQGTAPDERPAAPTAPVPAAKPAANTQRDLVYAEVGGRKLHLDLYQPTPPDDGKPTEARPVILWIHGGGWQGGDKSRAPASQLVAHGYVVASVEYRLSGVAAFPAQIYDCKGAVRWVRAHAKEYNIDPTRVGVWGASAGGHLAALLGTSGDVKELEGDVGGNADQSSRVQAVVDWFGPTDMVALATPDPSADEQRQQAFEAGIGMIVRFLGGTVESKRDVYVQASPTTHITPDDAPTLIMHGDADPLVPLNQSKMLEDQLNKVKVPVTLEVIKGAGHGALGPTAQPRVADWFDKQFKKPPTASGAKDEAKPAAK